MPAWRYIASSLNGNGTETFLNYEVPISGLELEHNLSGHDAITGTIEPEITTLKNADGSPLFKRWKTAIYVELDGNIVGGGIFNNFTIKDSQLGIDCVGFTGYAQGQPYNGEVNFIKQDPLDLYRHMWIHLQGQPRGNLGLTWDMTVSPVRYGVAETNTQFTTSDGETVAFDKGPYRLNWFTHHDLGKEMDSLAKNAPFDYRLRHSWNPDGTIKHHISLGYPMLGRRRHDLRMVVGENIFETPEYEGGGDEYADTVIVLGPGSGRTMIRGSHTVATDSLRRVKTLKSSQARSKLLASRMAQREAKRRAGDIDISEFTVLGNHPNSMIGTFEVGDEVLIQNYQGWNKQPVWVRILSMTIKPEQSGVDVSVVRADKVGA